MSEYLGGVLFLNRAVQLMQPSSDLELRRWTSGDERSSVCSSAEHLLTLCYS